MSRGGYLALRIAVLLTGDSWTDLSVSALGAWVRIKATNDLTEEPVSLRAAERLGVSADNLAELEAAGLLEEADGMYSAGGMAGIKDPRPSDSPAAVAERMRRYRARQKEKSLPAPSEEKSPVTSSPVQVTSVTRSYDVTETSETPEEPSERPNDPMREESESVDRTETAPRVRSEGVSLPPEDALRLAMAYTRDLEAGVSS